MSIENVLNRIESIKERIGYYSSFVDTTSVGGRDRAATSRPKQTLKLPSSSFKQVMEGVAKEKKEERVVQKEDNRFAQLPPFLPDRTIGQAAKKEETGFDKVPFIGEGILGPQSKGEKISSLIQAYGAKYDVDPALISSIIKAESNFDPRAVSSAGAEGLMQLMPGTARELGVENSFDVEENIEAGTRYFKGLLDRFGGNLELALAAYNAGPQRVERASGIPNIKETKGYVSKVLKHYREEG